MKIALLTETWHPYTNGVITHVDVLRRGLKEQGHEVLVIAADPTTPHHTLNAEGILLCPARRVKQVYDYGLSTPFSFQRYGILRQFQPDVIHIHQEFGIGTFGWLASRMLRTPLIYTLHTAYDEYLHYLASPPLIPLVRTISRSYVKMLANASCVTTGPSQKAAVYLKERGVSTPFVLIPNSVDRERFDPAAVDPQVRSDIRKKFKIQPHDIAAIFVGRLGEEKSVSDLLTYWSQAYRFESSLHLLIIGDGPQRESLTRQAAREDMQHRIHFAGKVLYDDMPAYYSAGDLYVSASTTEMMSIAMLEAQAMGLPVIQRDDPLNRHQVDVGINGFLYHDQNSFKEVMDLFKHLTQEERSAWRHQCAQYVSSHGASDLASRLLQIYRQALSTLKEPLLKLEV